MRLTLLGTGCPVVHPERYGPATLLQHEGRSLLVDCGSGVTQRLLAAGTPGKALDALLLTHLHSDHLVDLFQLVISSWHQGRDRPQQVFGPRGTRAYVEGLMRLWQAELAQRIAHERRPSTAALEVEVTELAGGERLAFGGIEVEVLVVDHQPVPLAFGFVFRAGGRRLVLSGDTRPCPALAEAAVGADLLLNEVFVHREMPVVPGLRTAETVARVGAYHTAATEVGKLAQQAGVGCLVLTHIVPPGADRAALFAEVRADFAGPLVVGEDLMTFDLAAGTLSWRGAVLGLGSAAPS